MRRCDLCGKDADVLQIAEEFRAADLVDICHDCDSTVSRAISVAMDKLSSLKTAIRKSVWRRAVEMARGGR